MRQFWINLHLYVAAFFTPVLLIIVISGGLYLIGIKGTTVETDIALPANATLDLDAGDLKEEVDKLLRAAGIKHSFGVHQTRWFDTHHTSDFADELRSEDDGRRSIGEPGQTGSAETAHRVAQGARAACVQTTAAHHGARPAPCNPRRALAGAIVRRFEAANRDRSGSGASSKLRAGLSPLRRELS